MKQEVISGIETGLKQQQAKNPPETSSKSSVDKDPIEEASTEQTTKHFCSSSLGPTPFTNKAHDATKFNKALLLVNRPRKTISYQSSVSTTRLLLKYLLPLSLPNVYLLMSN